MFGLLMAWLQMTLFQLFNAALVLRPLQPPLARDVFQARKHRKGFPPALPRVLWQRVASHVQRLRRSDGDGCAVCGLSGIIRGMSNQVAGPGVFTLYQIHAR